MPCAIGPLYPNARAASREVCIGLWSPETLAYSVPTSRPTRQRMPSGGSTASGLPLPGFSLRR